MQIWLSERLKTIEQPLNAMKYNLKSFTMRRNLFPRKTVAEWMSLLSHGGLSIRWVVPWWFIKEMVGSHESTPYVRLLGLRKITYFFPTRLLRQYGMKQVIPNLDTEPPACLELRGPAITAWTKYWANRPRWAFPRNGCSIQLTPSYKDWMLAKSKEEKDKARGLEATERSKGPKVHKTSKDKTSSEKGQTETSLKRKNEAASVFDRLGPRVKKSTPSLPGIKIGQPKLNEKAQKTIEGKGKGKMVWTRKEGKPKPKKKQLDEGSSKETHVEGEPKDNPGGMEEDPKVDEDPKHARKEKEE